MIKKTEIGNGNRGDRYRPSRMNRSYYHLTRLKSKYVSYVSDAGRLNTPLKLIDYGCGNCPYRELFVSHGYDYIACDLEDNDYTDSVLNQDGTLPIADAVADIVLSSQVLEHVTDPAKYLHESQRVLKPGGNLILSTHGVWRYHPDPTDYWRWTSMGLKKILKDHNFKIEIFNGVMGPIATSIQIFQDAVGFLLPYGIRHLFFFTCQLLMQLGDIVQKRKTIDNDACVYFIVATKNGD